MVGRFPYYTVSIADGCLVNGRESIEIYASSPYLLMFTYIGDSNSTLIGWNIYDAEGNLLDYVFPSDTYTLTVFGGYYVSPVFS